MKSAAQQIVETNRDSIQKIIALVPMYRSTRTLKAARIAQVNMIAGNESVMVTILGADGLHRLPVDALWLQRYAPQVGGYFCTFGDGFPWFLSAKEFEANHAPIGLTLAEFARDFCMKVQMEGYDAAMTDDQIFAAMPDGVMDSLTLRYVAAKMSAL